MAADEFRPMGGVLHDVDLRATTDVVAAIGAQSEPSKGQVLRRHRSSQLLLEGRPYLRQQLAPELVPTCTPYKALDRAYSP